MINSAPGFIEERVKLSILLDLYGDLLTEKQKDVMDLYYNDDLSLAEISEITKTSRQAVHDVIKRCHKLLIQYEEKLRLMNKKFNMKQVKTNILEKIDKIQIDDKENLEKIQEIRKYVIDNV